MKDLTGYKLTFRDEFDNRSISQGGEHTKWSDIRPEFRFDANADIGFGRSSFVDPASGYDPFKVSNGALSITAHTDQTRFGYPGNWESGLIHTRGEFAQTYGYFEMRADLSDVKGAWDAFWLLPVTPVNTNKAGWQELDVVEHYGSYTPGVYSWIHTTDYHSNPNETLQTFSSHLDQAQGFHTYGMDWKKDTIDFYYDGQLMGTRATPSDMHGPMYLLADLAVRNDADVSGPAPSMKIDYIRAYASDPNAIIPTPGLTINGTPGRDAVQGKAGDDVIDGKDGNDVLSGNGGNDVLRGGNGNDTLDGGAGEDRIAGKSGNDVLRGGADHDQLWGDYGNDVLNGGTGKDMLSGGPGNDSFVFSTAYVDTITDFSNASGNNDRLHLENAVFTALPQTGALAASAFAANASGTATDAGDRVVYETDTGKLFYDADGNGSGDAAQIAVLSNHATLTAADFLII